MRWPLIKYLPEKTNLKFVGPSRIFAVISILAVLGSIAATLLPLKPPCAGLNCGIDFTGGTVLELTTEPRPIDFAAVRGAVGELGLGDVQVQGFSTSSDPTGRAHASLRFETPDGLTTQSAVDRVQTAVRAAIGEDVRFDPPDVVGAKVSGELFQAGLTALVLAVALMLVYIWFRFGLTFGIGAVVALFHDVVLTFGLFALTDLEFNLTSVAAILTIIGYSMNDTVVVLDRVRENLRKYKKMPLRDLIDLSINETLSRTIITGITGIMALTGLAVFGGEALFSFSVAMIFGIVIGTYSSIFVAAPVLLMLGVRRDEAEPLPQPTRGRAVPRP